MTGNAIDTERVGLVQVYTGDGKGKTTAALGLALRAAGSGMRTYIGQFLKGQDYGELESVKHLAPLVTIEQYGLNGWVHVDRITPEQRKAAQQGLAAIREALVSGQYDIVVADELNIAVAFGLVTEQDVLDLIDLKPADVELVITGRRAPDAIMARADLVTEMREVKHPYQQGIQARQGIEF